MELDCASDVDAVEYLKAECRTSRGRSAGVHASRVETRLDARRRTASHGHHRERRRSCADRTWGDAWSVHDNWVGFAGCWNTFLAGDGDARGAAVVQAAAVRGRSYPVHLRFELLRKGRR